MPPITDQPIRVLAHDFAHIRFSPGAVVPYHGLDRYKAINVYDLRNGALITEVIPPDDSKFFDVAPDRSRILIQDDGAKELEIWRLGERPEKEIAWDPGLDHSTYVKWAVFVSPDEVLTGTNGGDLMLWSLPGPKRVYETYRLQYNVGPQYNVRPPRFTPDRRYLYDAIRYSVRFIDVKTGEMAGNVRLGDLANNDLWLGTCSISNDGTQVACFCEGSHASSRLLGAWDLNSGQRKWMALLPDNKAPTTKYGPGICWLDKDFLLVGHYLFSIKHQRAVWRYKNQPLGCLPDGRVWVGKRIDQQNVLLAAVNLPGADVLDHLATNPDFGTPQIAQGAGFSIQVQLKVRPPEADFQQRLTEMLEQKLVACGYRVADAHPNSLRVVISDRDTGKTVRLGKFTRFKSGTERYEGQTLELPDRILSCVTDVIDSNGNSVDQLTRTFATSRLKATIEIKGDWRTTAQNARWNEFLMDLDRFLRFKGEYGQPAIPESDLFPVVNEPAEPQTHAPAHPTGSSLRASVTSGSRPMLTRGRT